MNEDADETDSYVITHSQDTSPLDRCARIDTEIVEYQLEFDRLSFGAERKEDEPSEGGNGGDGSPPFQPYRASPRPSGAESGRLRYFDRGDTSRSNRATKVPQRSRRLSKTGLLQ